MRYCSNCGKEFQEDVRFCPSCGTPVLSNANGTQSDETVSSEETKKHSAVAIVITAFVLFIVAGFLCFNDINVSTYNQFADLYNTMAAGAVKAETANILIIDVWKNSIFKTDDAETDKFTKKDIGSGQFYEDFNDALARLYSDQNFIDDLAEIQSLQIEAEALIKNLAKHPKAYDAEYLDFKDCYNLFLKFTNMSLNGSGSLNSFTDDHNELDESIVGKLNELDIYFD